MGYYQRPMGDYSTGGYYQQGDPGLFGFIGKAVKSIWKVAKPIIGTAIGGPIGGAILGVGAGVAASKALVPVGPPAPPTGFFPAAGAAVGTAMGAAIPGAIAGYMGGGGCPAGYHPDKRTGTRCVRNRRMNVANPRALRRSLRRVKGFEKLARRTIVQTRRVRAR